MTDNSASSLKAPVLPKTKILWSLSQSSFEKKSRTEIAAHLCAIDINALRVTVTPSLLPRLQALREDISAQLRSTLHRPNVGGLIPFVCSLVGRRARLRVPNGSRDIPAGEPFTVLMRTDFEACVHPDQLPHPSDVEIVMSSADVANKIAVGSQLTVSYGQTVLEVTGLETTGGQQRLKVVASQPTQLLSGMDIHSPNLSRQLLPLLPQDEEVINHKFSHIADYVIIHGVNSKEELLKIKARIMPEHSGQGSLRHPSVPVGPAVRDSKASLPPRWIWKVDSRESLELLPTILENVDGVLLSRSELGLTIPPNSLPIIQKDLLARCNQAAKIVIVASELMYSMRVNPNPTRAEVSDLANAAADGADALLLAEEVTEGPFGPLVAEMSQETLVNAAPFLESNWNRVQFQAKSDEDAIAYGALKVAREIGARAIVCLTEGGYTAYRLASLRTPVEVIAISYNENIMRQLALVNSVRGMTIDSNLPFDQILAETKLKLHQSFGFNKGDKIVFVSLTASSVSARNSNIFTVQEID
ncbi:MAG: pyruvate kinase [Silvanigrellaceae bacterium]